MPAEGSPVDPNQPAAAGPQGPGWIVSISGYHYHNLDRQNQGAEYVRHTLIESLRNAKVKLPSGEGGALESVPMSELGVSYPVLVDPKRVVTEELTDPNVDLDTAADAGGMAAGMPGAAAGHPAAGNHGPTDNKKNVQRFNFEVQFCWQPKTPSQRHEPKKPQDQAGLPAQP